MSSASSEATTRLGRARDRLIAYWAAPLNRIDTVVLSVCFLSFVMSYATTGLHDHGITVPWDLTALRSLSAVACFLLWFRLCRVLLVSAEFVPYVLMPSHPHTLTLALTPTL